MAKNMFESFNAAIADKQLILLYDHIEDFIDNKEFNKEVYKKFSELETFISRDAIGSYVLYMTINIDNSYNCNLTFSSAFLWYSLYQMLSCESEFNSSNTEILEKQIKKLKSIETEEEFKKEFPYLYERTYKVGRATLASDPQKCKAIIDHYEAMRDQGLAFFENWKNSQKKQGNDMETVYNYVCLFQNFKMFRNKAVKYFESIIGTDKKPGKADKIEKWMKDNPIKVKLKKDEQKKLLLYIMNQNVELITAYIRKGFYVDALRNFSILGEMLDTYSNMYPYDKTEIKFYKNPISANVLTDKPSIEIVCNIELIYSKYFELLSENPFLQKNIKLPEFDKSLNFEENMKNINQYLYNSIMDTIEEERDRGAEDVTEKVYQKLDELEEEYKKLSDKERNEKALILKKLRMVLKDIKPGPRAITTGTGNVFKKYYVYYYDTGMVAVDKIDGYGRMYIMPVHVFQEAKYKNKLSEVANMYGVVPIHHANKNWLTNAKEYIEHGTDNLTEADIEYAKKLASIDFPYDEKSLEKLERKFEAEGNEQGVIEAKRRIEKIERFNSLKTKLKDFDVEVGEQGELSPDEMDERNEQLEHRLNGLQLTSIDNELRSNEFTPAEEYVEQEQKELESQIQSNELSPEEIEKRKFYILTKKNIMDRFGEEESEAEDEIEINRIIASNVSFKDSYINSTNRNKKKKNAHNPHVTAETKKRAMVGGNFRCEWCEKLFIDSSGVHCHHIDELGKGGVDNIYNTACLCPTCHNYFHSSWLYPKYKFDLLMKTKKHIIEEYPEYLPQFNELLNKMFSPEDQKFYDEFYKDEWSYINVKVNKKL